VFSAVGLLLADLRVDKIWTQAFRSTDVDAALVQSQFERITERALNELREEGFEGEPTVERAINMRYLGQNYEHEIRVHAGEITADTLHAAFDSFASMHRVRYGYAIEGETIELVSFKVTAVGQHPEIELREPDAPADAPQASARQVYFAGEGWVETTVVHRSSLERGVQHAGPLLIQEEGSTTLVPPGFTALKSPIGSLLVSSCAEEPS
jgi:N-methylhydantoinase A